MTQAVRQVSRGFSPALVAAGNTSLGAPSVGLGHSLGRSTEAPIIWYSWSEGALPLLLKTRPAYA
jgi:hypothetical protein